MPAQQDNSKLSTKQQVTTTKQNKNKTDIDFIFQKLKKPQESTTLHLESKKTSPKVFKEPLQPIRKSNSLQSSSLTHDAFFDSRGTSQSKFVYLKPNLIRIKDNK
jgi:hypothetical protein